MIIIRISIAILMVILLIFGVIINSDFIYLRLIFILAGIGSILDSFETFFQLKNDKRYLLDLGFAGLWFTLSFIV
ncbi:hypothetical protein [Virgibacillus profundi]|nr:hypothetical protein [Virgibacillus profundi]